MLGTARNGNFGLNTVRRPLVNEEGGNAMIYEVRTYTLKPGTVPEFESRFEQRHPYREKHSKLGAFWHTEMGPLNQVIHVWEYEDLQQREEARQAANQDPDLQRLPGGREFVAEQQSEIVMPAPFMHPLGSPAPAGGGSVRRTKF